MILTPSSLIREAYGKSHLVSIRRFLGRLVAEPIRQSDPTRLNPALPVITTYTLQDGEAGYAGTADAHIAGASPTLNYGATTTLITRWYVSGATYRNNVLLTFALPAFTTPPATILSATLTLYTSIVGTYGNEPIRYIEACCLRRLFGEGVHTGQSATAGECNWNEAIGRLTNWATPGADNLTYDRFAAFASLTTPVVDAPISLDCLTPIAQVYAGTLAWKGFLLRYSALTRSYAHFASRQDATQSHRPKLVIVTSTPG